MFLFTEITYRITRSLGRTMLLAVAALMLVGSMGIYLSNMQSSNASLMDLSETIPVTVRVLNRKGTADKRLSISTRHYDALAGMEVHGILCTAGAAGAMSEEAHKQNPFVGGDTSISGANCFDAVPAIHKEDVVYSDGYSGTFLSSEEAGCAIADSFAEEHDLTLGDQLLLPVYTASYSLFAPRYKPIGLKTLSIVAVYPYAEHDGQRTPDMTVPIAWLRNAAESAGEDFTYSSLSAVMDQPLELNQFKEGLKANGFRQVDYDDYNSGAYDVVSVEDELFIKTAEELHDHLQTYRAFQLPFLGLITVMVMLIVFLVLRSSRRDIAIASSLGEPRIRIGFIHFSSSLLTQMLGCCLAAVILMIHMKIHLGESLGIILVYLLCASSGTIMALAALFRFDSLALLAKD